MTSSSNANVDEIQRICEWMDHSDWNVLDRGLDSKRDIEFCTKLLQQTSLIEITSFGVNASSTSPPDWMGGDQEGFIEDTQRTVVPETTSIAQRFTNPKLIGTGAYGIIFSALDTKFQMPVALKFLRPSKSDSADTRNRFFGEAQTTARLSHPGIIRIYDTGKLEGLPFITSELADSGPLTKWLKTRNQLLSTREAASMVAQVAEAIQYAHSRLTLHRDIKPSNILLVKGASKDTEGLGVRPVVTDFGLSKRLEPILGRDHTHDGLVIGTVRYMSPEQARGDIRSIGTTSDIYSLGVVLYELLAGVVPFDNAQDRVVQSMVIHTEVPSPWIHRPSVPRDLEAITMKCLRKNPADRYQTAQELATDLRRFLNGESVAARKSTPLRNLVRTVRKYPLVTGLMVLLFGISTMAALVIQRSRKLERETSDWALENIARVGSTFGDRILEGNRVSATNLLEILEPEIQFLGNQVERGEQTPRILQTLSVLRHYASISYSSTGEFRQAYEQRLKVIEIQERLLSLRPNNSARLRFQMAHSYYWLASLSLKMLVDSGLKTQSPDALLEQGLAITGELLKAKPDDVDVADLENAMRYEMGTYFQHVRRYEEACNTYDRIIRDSTTLAKRHRDRPLLAVYAMRCYYSKADIYELRGEYSTAKECYRSAKAFVKDIYQDAWDQRWTVRDVADLYVRSIRFLARREEFKELLDETKECEDWFSGNRGYLLGEKEGCTQSPEAFDYWVLANRRLAAQRMSDDVEVQRITHRMEYLARIVRGQSIDLTSIQEFLAEDSIATPELDADDRSGN